jgi:hypothetical protein
MTKKKLGSLVKDIYQFLEKGEVDVEALSKDIATSLASKIGTTRTPSLSMSQLGKPARRLWNDINYPAEVGGQARLKFLYGDIIEAVILHLAKAAGHTVTDQQKVVEVDGVKGAIDAVIDSDYLVDVKSASPYTFEKFKKSTLADEDSFGYLPQINGYNEKLKKPYKAFIVVNKVTGEILVYNVDDYFESVDVHKLIKDKKEMLESEQPPQPCYNPVPFGKSGNEVVPKQCKWCPHLKRCWKDAKPVEYSTGIEYFTKIVKMPKKLKETL